MWPPTGPAAQPTPAPQPQPAMTPDMMGWQSIRTSTNPEEIEAFTLTFRDSPFAGMTRAGAGEGGFVSPTAHFGPPNVAPGVAPDNFSRNKTLAVSS